ncbi:hypothetical protein HN371_08055 [Candidatus Poribacteria bacterium]|jgi:hypothetical protein|nr:hypothetical protein [Candidatus Poribacteria bacterium]MBT5534861.1 hypothetical protein [Candidatus Poribacteria bacterium]MBT7805361.1 hypothetical protein [Candidatus Poribacteria bacterium]
MLHAGRRWVSLGRAAKMLGMHYRTLVRHLDDPADSGFEVLERPTINRKRLRYLAVDEIQKAMGETPVVSGGR